MPIDVSEIMESLRVDNLKSLAKRVGIPKDVTRKPELIAALDRFLKANPASFVERLGPVEKDVLAEAVYNQNRVNRTVFSAKYQVEFPRLRAYDKMGSLLEMVTTDDPEGLGIEVPKSIGELLKPLLEKPAAPRPATIEKIPETLDLREPDKPARPDDIRPIHVYSGERTALVELRRVLQSAQGGKLRTQPKSGRPTPATERAIAALLASPDFDLEMPAELCDGYSLKPGAVRAHAWAVLVQQCGWCKASGETLKLTKEGGEMLESGSLEAFARGVDSFGFDDDFDELNRVNHIRGQAGKNRRWLSDSAERRESVLDGMVEWPVNEWMEFDEAFRFLNASGHTFSVTNDSDLLYFGERRYGAICDDDGIDRQYLRALLFESLAALGLVDVAYVYPHLLWPELSGNWGTDDLDYCGRYDGLLYVRLNGLGAYCLGLTEHYSPAPAEARKLFTVLPNREIAVAGEKPLLPSDEAMLEQFAGKQSDRLWNIDPQRLLDYLETGERLEDVTQFLEAHATAGIPETVHVFFRDLQAKAGAVVGAEEAMLIEFRDPVVAALVAHDAKAGKLCVQAGERHVAVPKKNERAFRTALKKLGYILP